MITEVNILKTNVPLVFIQKNVNEILELFLKILSPVL